MSYPGPVFGDRNRCQRAPRRFTPAALEHPAIICSADINDGALGGPPLGSGSNTTLSDGRRISDFANFLVGGLTIRIGGFVSDPRTRLFHQPKRLMPLAANDDDISIGELCLHA